jgi:hypothetical protein
MLVRVSQFADVLRLLERLKREGVVADYAIAGAMAANFWDEAVATQDLDVVVMFREPPSPLDPPADRRSSPGVRIPASR